MGNCTSHPDAQCRQGARRRSRHHHHNHHHHARRAGQRGKKYLPPATNANSTQLLAPDTTHYSAAPHGPGTANGQLQHQGSSRLTQGGASSECGGQRTPQGPPYLFGRRSSNLPRDVGGSQRDKGGENGAGLWGVCGTRMNPRVRKHARITFKAHSVCTSIVIAAYPCSISTLHNDACVTVRIHSCTREQCTRHAHTSTQQCSQKSPGSFSTRTLHNLHDASMPVTARCRHVSVCTRTRINQMLLLAP